MVERAWNAALKTCQLNPDQVDVAIVTGTHARAVRAAARKLGAKSIADNLDAAVGNTGAAHFGVVLADVLDKAEPDTTIAVVVLADGVEVLLFRTTEAIASFSPAKSVADQIARSAVVPYGKFLTWRNMVEVDHPIGRPPIARLRQPRPARRTGNSGSSGLAICRPASSTFRRNGSGSTAARPMTWSRCRSPRPWRLSPPTRSTGSSTRRARR